MEIAVHVVDVYGQTVAEKGDVGPWVNAAATAQTKTVIEQSILAAMRREMGACGAANGLTLRESARSRHAIGSALLLLLAARAISAPIYLRSECA